MPSGLSAGGGRCHPSNKDIWAHGRGETGEKSKAGQGSRSRAAEEASWRRGLGMPEGAWHSLRDEHVEHCARPLRRRPRQQMCLLTTRHRPLSELSPAGAQGRVTVPRHRGPGGRSAGCRGSQGRKGCGGLKGSTHRDPFPVRTPARLWECRAGGRVGESSREPAQTLKGRVESPSLGTERPGPASVRGPGAQEARDTRAAGNRGH